MLNIGNLVKMDEIKHWNMGMICIACIALLSFNSVVSAQPPIPFNPWGTATIHGSPAPDGSVVEAYIQDTLFATMHDGTSNDYYSIIIPADDPDTPEKEGGINGDEVIIKVNGNASLPTLTWTRGSTERVDLVLVTRTIVVNQTSPACTSGDYYYSTVQEAVDVSNNGDTIIVCPGTYYENVFVDASVNILSYSSPTIINASHGGDNGFSIYASNVNISGFTITGASWSRAGVYLAQVDHCNITNNDISNNNYAGIDLALSNANSITNNEISSNSKYGIFLGGSNNTIKNNNISLNNRGIYLGNASIKNSILYNNIYDNTGYDIYNDQQNNIVAELNWWGTIYCTLIDSHIYDNEEGKGEVDFEPILNAPYPSGISIPCARLPIVVNQTSPACTPGYSYYPTIKGAINSASSGDTIIVCPGTYNENVLVDVSVNIISYAGPSVTIVKNASNPREHVFSILANDVNISGFAVTGTKPGPFAGICIWGDYCNISNNHAFNCDVGIIIFSNNNIIANNTASNNSYGIYLYSSSDNTISNNVICENKYDGIHLEDSSHNYIYLNNFVNNTNNAYSFKLKNIWNSSWKMIYVYDGKVWESYFGNYWDNYSGPDTNNDGIGDVPYTIDLDKDNYPLMEPFGNYFVPTQTYIFDTGSPVNPYPSIMGNHTGAIKPNLTVIATKLYTYPCAETGGHTEYAEIRNATWNATATWKGYVGDWHNITFDKTVVLLANKTYNYIIRTGSYPQIHHTDNLEVVNDMGTITCDKFIDANGKVYYDWIPAIKLFCEEGNKK